MRLWYPKIIRRTFADKHISAVQSKKNLKGKAEEVL